MSHIKYKVICALCRGELFVTLLRPTQEDTVDLIIVVSPHKCAVDWAIPPFQVVSGNELIGV